MSQAWLCRQGCASGPGELVVWAKSPTSGVLSARIGATSWSGSSVNPPVLDGVGIVRITGLSDDTEYTVAVYLDGVLMDTLAMRTYPGESAVWHFVWTSCFEPFRQVPLADAIATGRMASLIPGFDPRILFIEGDFPYTTYGGDYWDPLGVWDTVTNISTSGSYATATNEQLYHDAHSMYHRIPSMYRLMRMLQTNLMADDHERTGDNWCHTVTHANAYSTLAATQADVDAIFYASNQAIIATQMGNPPNTSELAIAQKPPGAAAGTLVSNYPPLYHDFVVGSVHFIVLDYQSHRSSTLVTDNASKTMLGAAQKAWLKARLLASAAPLKAIMAPKKLYRCVNDNDDIYDAYSTERAEIETFIAANGITGVGFFAGDRHITDVSYTETSPVCINACSATVSVLNQGADYNPGIAFKPHGWAGDSAGHDEWQGMGICEVHGSEYMAGMFWTHGKKRPYYTRIYAGSNAPVYERIKVA